MDRNVLIQRIGAGRHDDFVDGIDVIWTAPTLGHDPRTVVGWYRNARVYRKRQKFSTLPRPVSEPHRIGRMDSYMVRARNENVFLLPVKQRTLNLGRGRSGWSGQTSWWYAEVTPNPEAAEFVEIVKAMMDSGKVQPITSS
ncbi:hypothetical protein ACT6QH_04535 [Xanthobacter sp. TB0139]|uniref:hypothetical protein n=1 Tax=Xanthobacter sp. TB0139 TaxID=3459178 RepID=UPI004039CF87